jgi:hypothetical protein
MALDFPAKAVIFLHFCRNIKRRKLVEIGFCPHLRLKHILAAGNRPHAVNTAKEKIEMKKLFRVFTVLAGIALVASCDIPVGNDDDDVTVKGGVDSNGVDWTDYQTDGSYSIRIKNESNRDLVVFKSSLTAASLLGGVAKGATNHGLPKTSLFGTQSTDFSLIILTKEDYEANKNNLTSLEQKPFTRIFAVYNAAGTNDIPFLVDSKLGGTNKLVLQNLTSYNMEIRRDSPRGATLGYAPYLALNTTIYLIDGNYDIFPVFKKYDANRDLITTIYPKRSEQAGGGPMRNGFSAEGNSETEWNASDYTSGLTDFSSGYAYLVVVNNSSNGVQVMKGSTVQQTATGMKMVNAVSQRTFMVEMPAVTNGDGTVFEEKTVFAGWTIGQTGDPKDIPVSNGLKDSSVSGGTNANVFESDYMYTITVTGNANTTGLVISQPVKGAKVTP